MNIVQPGSATVNSNAALTPPACTRADRRSPTLRPSSVTGTSTTCWSDSPLVTTASPLKPSPSMTIDVRSLTSLTVTRTSCEGACGGPTNSSVDSAEMSCIGATLRWPGSPTKPLADGKGGGAYLRRLEHLERVAHSREIKHQRFGVVAARCQNAGVRAVRLDGCRLR